MITIRLMGGLGNQLFQYALGRALACLGNAVDFDRQPVDADRKRSYSLDAFRTVVRFHPTSSHPWPIIKEAGLEFKPYILNVRQGTLEGYWQTEKYFSAIERVLREDLTLRQPPSVKSLQVAEKIANVPNSVFLHVRRGDNITDPNSIAFHGTPSESYYQYAALKIKEQYTDTHFFVFSDDPEWCRRNIYGPNFTLVEHNKPGGAQAPGQEHEDLWLMSLCRHAIVANSSFSWWGAWLGPQGVQRTVIVPQRWYRSNEPNTTDLIPDRWTKL